MFLFIFSNLLIFKLKSSRFFDKNIISSAIFKKFDINVGIPEYLFQKPKNRISI